ncbi:MAG: sodium/glutamate symporter [Gammaproteobacteria bacterium]
MRHRASVPQRWWPQKKNPVCRGQGGRALLVDFCIISVLLVAGNLLRAAVPWLSRYLVPTPMIAGIAGLIAGPGGYDVLPFFRDAAGNADLGSYPGILIVLLFATLLLGHRAADGPRVGWRASGTSFCYNMAAEFMQYGITLCVGVALLAWVFVDLRPEFIVMLPAGFAGGHGTAALYADALSHWDAARSIGFTFATIGIFAAVFGGLLLTNIARRKGWVMRGGTPNAGLAAEQATFVPGNLQVSAGTTTVNGIALESLTWHAALVFTVYGATMALMPHLRELLPPRFVLPAFAVAMMLGWLLQTVLNLLRAGEYVDAKTVGRLGSLVSDYLVAFGIASINVQLVLTYAVPLVVFALLGLVICVGWLLLVAPRVFGPRWFEDGIFTYGWSTATVPFGIALLRIADTRGDSRALAHYGVAYVAIGPLEAVLYTIVIAAAMSGQLLPLGVALIATALVLVVVAMRSRVPAVDQIPQS